VTPAAGRRASELDIDPASLAGTGIEGAVTVADVEAAVQRQAVPTAAAGRASRRTGFDPTESARRLPPQWAPKARDPALLSDYTVDLGQALSWLETFNAVQPLPLRLLPGRPFAEGERSALRERRNSMEHTRRVFHPGDGVRSAGDLAAWWWPGRARDPQCRKVGLPALMTAMRDLVQRARNGGLRSSELGSPTITVTSLGDRGAEAVTGIIYPPQVGIIGFGSISTRPWVTDGRVEARPLVTANLAADHRATDGHIGGRLLNAISRLLQEPEKL
jgi:pyruvate dehydrogenase E2 component (dihydrolipoamide acetyltransferase)